MPNLQKSLFKTGVSLAYLGLSGVTNTVARVAIGVLAILPWVNTIIVHNMSLILMGIALIGNQFCVNFHAMCVSAGVFGIGLGKTMMPDIT